MLSTLLNKLGLGDGSNNIEVDPRRKYIRFEGAHAEIELGQQSVPVRDWSQGGVFFDTTPGLDLNEGDKLVATLRFRFPHETVSVQQQIRVVRTARRGVAVEFGPQSNDDRKQFSRIIDNYNAENFLASQTAA